MAERYSRVYTLPEALYAEGSPVLIAAGALLKDNQTGKILAQLKFKSFAPKAIKALTAEITASDAAGRILGNPVSHPYLDLSVARDTEFGQKEPVDLPDNTARSYTVRVTEAVFADGEVWTAGDAVWEPMLTQGKLLARLGKSELVRQYCIATSSESALIPTEYKDLWLCACGTVNRGNEASCHTCRRGKDLIFRSLDTAALQEASDARLAEEAAEARRKQLEAERQAEAIRITAVEQAKKTKKILAILLPLVAVCIAAILIVTKVILPNKSYNEAMALMDAEQYEEAITAFEAVDGYKDSDEQIEACVMDIAYNEAVALMDAEQYEEAIATFKTLDGYKDAEEQTVVCETALLSKAEVGSTLFFGAYEQDNNTSNGKEAIEWCVLAKKDNKILVISENALDCQQYNNVDTDVTWETCSLREWMNVTFLNDAFTEEEQAIIQSTNVSADKNPKYSTSPGNDTMDKVFLLSISEAEEYLTTNKARKCVPTAYTKAQGTSTSSRFSKDGAATCWWWLRSPGYEQDHATGVYTDGSVNFYGNYVRNDIGCVRPALWINLDS